MPSLHLIIRGKVQGVFYRASAKETADKIGITGWIKNTPDENVEAMITGNDDQLQQFVEWCRRGPRNANVTQVIATPQEEVFYANFLIIR
jgi:acylphosphatase